MTYLTDPAAHVLATPTSTWISSSPGDRRDATGSRVRRRRRSPLRPAVRPPERRRALRAELGIPADAPVALIGAGSLGLGDVPRTVAAILHHPRAHAVVLCGRNGALRRRWAGDPRVTPLGWRDDVADLMAAADLLVHNAGGLSLTEALVAGLPAVTYLPIPGHGRANAAVLDRAGVASWPRNPQQLADTIERLASTAPRPLPMPSLAGRSRSGRRRRERGRAGADRGTGHRRAGERVLMSLS